jgi:hypothetical protein
MKAPPLSKLWAVEYHFFQDAFSVRPLPDYLTHAQNSFNNDRFFDSVILALHPTETGAHDECSTWQERRNDRPQDFAPKIKIVRALLKGLESRL